MVEARERPVEEIQPQPNPDEGAGTSPLEVISKRTITRMICFQMAVPTSLHISLFDFNYLSISIDYLIHTYLTRYLCIIFYPMMGDGRDPRMQLSPHNSFCETTPLAETGTIS